MKHTWALVSVCGLAVLTNPSFAAAQAFTFNGGADDKCNNPGETCDVFECNCDGSQTYGSGASCQVVRCCAGAWTPGPGDVSACTFNDVPGWPCTPGDPCGGGSSCSCVFDPNFNVGAVTYNEQNQGTKCSCPDSSP